MYKQPHDFDKNDDLQGARFDGDNEDRSTTRTTALDEMSGGFEKPAERESLTRKRPLRDE